MRLAVQRPSRVPALCRGVALGAAALLLAGCGGAGGGGASAESIRQRLAAEDPIGATLQARTLLKERSSSAEGRFLLALALLRSGDLAGAETELRRVAEAGYDPNQVAPVTAELLLAKKQPRDVLGNHAATRLDDADAQRNLRVLVATAHRDLGDAVQANRVLDEVLQDAPAFAPAVVLKARLAASAGDLATARRLADGLVESQPKSPQAWVLRGDLLLQPGGDLQQAAAAYQKALELAPRMVEGHAGTITARLRQPDLDGAGGALQAMAKVLPGHPTTQYYDAMIAFLRGDHRRARTLVQPLLQRVGDEPRVMFLASMVEARAGSTEQAISLMTKVMNQNPEAPAPRRELAGMALQAGQTERGRALLEPLAASQPDDPVVWRLLGRARVQAGDFKGADAAYARARQLNPKDAGLRAEVGLAQVVRGDLDAGVRELQLAASEDKRSLTADLELVAVMMKRGDVAGALKVVDGMAAKQPDSSVPDFVRGRVLQARGDIAGARKAYEAVVAKSPDNVGAVSSLAELDLQAKDLPAARARYEALLKKYPKVAPAMLALAVITRQGGGGRAEAVAWVDKAVKAAPLDADIWRQAIDYHRRESDVEGLLARARDAVAALPGSAELHIELGAAQLSAGQVEAAVGSLSKAVSLAPQSPDARLRLAQALVDAKRLPEARASVDNALSLAPAWEPALRAHLALLLLEQRADVAAAFVQRWQKQAPQRAIGFDLEGDLFAAQRNGSAAAASYRKALAKEESRETAIKLHRTLLGQPSGAAEAQALAQRWLKAQPQDVGFVLYLAESAAAAGRLDEAEQRYREALKLKPADPFILNNLASVLIDRKSPQAVAVALEAAKLAPYVPAVLDTLAHAYAEAGQLKQAVTVQVQAQELVPADAVIRLRLVKLLARAGDKEQARRTLQPLLRPETPAEQRREAEEAARSLGA